MQRQCLPAKEAPPGSWGPIAPHAHCRNLTTAAFLKYLVCGLIGSWALPINPVEASLNCRSFFFFFPLFSSLGLDFPGDSSAQASTW